MERLHVALEERGYDICIGERLMAQAGELLKPLIPGSRVFVITDEVVAKLYLHRLSNALATQNIAVTPIIIPAGEHSKSFAMLEHVMNNLLAQKPDRKTILIALGGGVVGDLTGFAASILLRGVDFIQIPTTLLSQVDSSVGGKTGINTEHGKNLVGTFYQPKCVLIDTSVLSTLPERELRAGYAEVVKYGLIHDEAFFSWLETNVGSVFAKDSASLSHIIQSSCASKAAIVAADEREQKNLRALLNLGHTFGHALEAETGFSSKLLHGEAVAVGMQLAFDLSVQLGLCPASDALRVKKHLQAAGLYTSLQQISPTWDVDALLEHMKHDKKAVHGKLAFILARGIGQAFVAEEVDMAAVRQVLVSA